LSNDTVKLLSVLSWVLESIMLLGICMIMLLLTELIGFNINKSELLSFSYSTLLMMFSWLARKIRGIKVLFDFT
jgi:hypothetical protein